MSKFKKILRDEFERRGRERPGYSIRAFANEVGISVSVISTALNGKSLLTNKNAFKVAKACGFSKEKAEDFVAQVEISRRSLRREKSLEKINARLGLKAKLSKSPVLDLEVFKDVMDWQHWAILELTYVAGFSSDPEWIAARLGIDAKTAAESIQKLVDHGLAYVSRKGMLRAVSDLSLTPQNVPSEAVRGFHSQILKKAGESLHNNLLFERSASSSVVCVGEAQFKEVQKRIDKFNIELIDFLSRDKSRDRVYALSFIYFPLDHSPQKEIA